MLRDPVSHIGHLSDQITVVQAEGGLVLRRVVHHEAELIHTNEVFIPYLLAEEAIASLESEFLAYQRRMHDQADVS